MQFKKELNFKDFDGFDGIDIEPIKFNKITIGFVFIGLMFLLLFESIKKPKITRSDVMEFIKWFFLTTWLTLLIGTPILCNMFNWDLPEFYPPLAVMSALVLGVTGMAIDANRRSPEYYNRSYESNKQHRYNHDVYGFLRDDEKLSYNNPKWEDISQKRINGGLTNKELKERKKLIRKNLIKKNITLKQKLIQKLTNK